MAPTISLPTREYKCYTVNHALCQLHIDRPKLFEQLVDFIINSLEDDYCYNPDSKAERKTVVAEWLQDLDQRQEMDWQARAIVKINTLNDLF
jgi:hypothetical protein